ncbi:hypothetical protein FRB97_006173 [Tulasnella sp. 331]|nr:hypothetical protein FRB97_006173 [Tulasnella sp. 331]KAG8878579.1 hypothetical protein FRB98_006048 [Tulasnella sp. 332]
MASATKTWAPKRSVQECMDILTKTKGSPHETETVMIDGQLQKAYKTLPPSLRHYWLDAISRHSSKEYIVFEKERYTFGDIHAKASKVASILHSTYGVRKGDKVAVVMRNYPEWLVAYWALQLLGAVTVSCNAWLPVEGTAPGKPGPLTHCITLAQSKVLILDAERATTLEKWLSQRRSKTGVTGVLVVRPEDTKEKARLRTGWKGMQTWDSAIAAYKGPTDLWKKEPDCTLEELSTIFFTSGTTGLPKGVPSTHRHYLSNLLNVIGMSQFRTLRNGDMPAPLDPKAPQVAQICAGPFFHVTGLLSSVGVATLMGFRLVLLRKWDKELVAGLIREENVESMLGVPFMTLDLADSSLQEHAKTLPAFGFSFGGSPASPAMVKDIMTKFPNAIMSQGYGLTESNSCTTVISGDDYINRPASTGIPAPTTEAIIVDEETLKVLKPGEQGEIWIRGSTVMKEYYRNPEATAKSITKDGWFRTGDIGLLDEEGFLYIKDRSKDLIIRGGENIDSTTVENAVYNDPRVLECAAIAVPDPKYGELVSVMYTTKEGFKGQIKEAALIAETKKHLPSFAVPVMAIEVNEMIRNAVGKVQKKDMRPTAVAEWERRAKAKAHAKFYLSGACNDGVWNVPTLVGTGPYLSPEGTGPTGADECRCSTVDYNLLQACSACQGGIVATWGDWIGFCNSSVVNVGFPLSTPAGTIIPGWAQLDPTTTGSWNATAAEEYAAAHSVAPTTSSTSKHSSNVGPIVGGVVGGIAFLVLLGLGIFCCLRHRGARESKGEKVTPIPYTTSNAAALDHGHHNGYKEKDMPNHRVDMGTPAPLLGVLRGSGSHNMKPYDPSDPTTFPVAMSPPPPSTYATHDQNLAGDYSQHGQNTSVYGGQTYPPYQSGSPQPYGSSGFAGQQSAMGAYTGAAEV